MIRVFLVILFVTSYDPPFFLLGALSKKDQE